MASTIPRVMAWLHETITVADWPAADGQGIRPAVSYGPPRHLEREHVIVGDSGDEEASQEWAGIGGGRREERFVIPITVYVLRPGDNARQALERAMALTDTIAALLLADPYVGLAPAVGQTIAGVQAESSQPLPSLDPEPEGYGCTVTFGVRVAARTL